MSTRAEGQEGWSVRVVDDDRAERLLDLLADEVPEALVFERERPSGRLDMRRASQVEARRPRVLLED